MPRFAVILPAAGKSSRFGDSRRKKPFVELKGRPIWLRAIEPFVNHDDVQQLIVVVSPEDLDWFKETFRPNLAFMNVDVVSGGDERVDSVANALDHLQPDIDYVAVHDAARPLVVRKWIDAVFAAAVKSGAAIPAARISSTVKRVANGVITETVPREQLWSAQTPQVFKKDLLRKAFEQRQAHATDEAQLVERTGQAVSIVECSPINLKITTQEDFRMAEELLNALPQQKPLRGLHPFADENPHLFGGL